jgi:hypothetical protein
VVLCGIQLYKCGLGIRYCVSVRQEFEIISHVKGLSLTVMLVLLLPEFIFEYMRKALLTVRLHTSESGS